MGELSPIWKLLITLNLELIIARWKIMKMKIKDISLNSPNMPNISLLQIIMLRLAMKLKKETMICIRHLIS